VAVLLVIEERKSKCVNMFLYFLMGPREEGKNGVMFYQSLSHALFANMPSTACVLDYIVIFCVLSRLYFKFKLKLQRKSFLAIFHVLESVNLLM
jgi:hypothetical protein